MEPAAVKTLEPIDFYKVFSMRVAAAQVRPTSGAFDKNIPKHRALIECAIESKVDLVLFPELSLTGCEPTLARDLALDSNATALEIFQDLSNSKGVIPLSISRPAGRRSGHPA